MRKQPTPPAQTGNTLSEYAIILGLIAVASVGALSLMGNSLSTQFDTVNQGNAHDSMTRMSNLNFDNGGKPSSNGGAQLPGKSIGANGYPLANVSSSGTNATSMDGNARKTLSVSYEVANKMLAMANQVDDPALKAWYKEAATRTLKLASSQAAYELASRNITDPDNQVSSLLGIKNNVRFGTDDAVKSIIQWQESLKTQLSQLSGIRTASPAEIQAAQNLTVSVLDANNVQYSDAIVKTDISRASVLDPDVNKIKKEAYSLDTSQIVDNIGLSTSVENGLTMEQNSQ